jgi:hypothetical protein
MYVFNIKMSRLFDWHNNHISPGVVSSVGDTNLSVKLKHSAPDLPLRWAPYSVGKRESRLGSYIQDGALGGKNARVFETGWLGKRGFKDPYGFVYQDIRAVDRLNEPVMGELPRYPWTNQVVGIMNQLGTGSKFSKLPKYNLTRGIVRGGLTPQVIATEGVIE